MSSAGTEGLVRVISVFEQRPTGSGRSKVRPSRAPSGSTLDKETSLARNSGRFRFDGGAGTYLGTGVLALLVTVFTLGICYPFALVLRERWRAKHTYLDGQRLTFTDTGIGLCGLWIKVVPTDRCHPRDLSVLGVTANPAVEGRAHRLRSHLASQRAAGHNRPAERLVAAAGRLTTGFRGALRLPGPRSWAAPDLRARPTRAMSIVIWRGRTGKVRKATNSSVRVTKRRASSTMGRCASCWR